jgi:hypothetical protein
MDLETLKLLQSISEVEKLMSIFDELESKYLRKAFVDTRFNEMVSHPDFLARLSKKEIDEEIRLSELKFKNDPYFYELLNKIRNEISKPEINEAFALFMTWVFSKKIIEKAQNLPSSSFAKKEQHLKPFAVGLMILLI